MTVLRQTQTVLEVLTQSSPNLRQTQTVLEALTQSDPHLRSPQVVVEVLTANNDGQVHLLLSQIVAEVLAVSYYDPPPVTGFTSRLGTNQSHLANIVLAAEGGTVTSVYENSLTVAGVSAVTLVDGGTLYKALSVDGIGAVTVSSNPIFQQTLTLTTVGDVILKLPYLLDVTITGLSGIIFLPGQPYFVTCAIEGLSEATPLPGTGFFDTLSIDCDAAVTIDSEAIKLLELSIDGVSATDESTIQNGRISLTVDGLSAIAISPSFSYGVSADAAAVSAIYVEGLYDFLDVVAAGECSRVMLRSSPGSENPVAQGSLTATCTGTFNRTVSQTLGLSHSGVIKKPTEIIDTFHIVSQTVAVQKVQFRSVTQTFSLTQDAVAKRSVVQTLSLSQSVDVTPVRSRRVSQTLGLVQVGARNVVLNRESSQTLLMGQARRIKTPIIGTIGNSNPTIFEYVQPVARPILVPVRCLTVLGVGNQTIVLPCPQFDDSQSRTSEVNLKRTMTGDTYTYVKRSELQKLKYLFWMGTKKAIEFQTFLETHCHELMVLINFKGETWYGNVTNNPFEFTASERWQNTGEKHEITIEFEGVQQ